MRTCCVSVLLLASLTHAAEPTPPPVMSLKEAPVNTWARIAWSPTGGREQPAFVYATNLHRFVMASGMQATGGVAPRHYDTEEFDLATAQWSNAYPAAAASGRPASGPVGEEYAKARVTIGYNGPELFYKDGDRLRLGAGGQWLTTRLGYEWCYVPANCKIYVCVQDNTLCYDPVQRTWEDLHAQPRTSGKVWGALCYDPVHQEIVHAGGDGASYEVGTWVYSLDGNEWRKLDFGSAAIKELQAAARQLNWQAKLLIGAAANRFAISETSAESQADLRKQAGEIVRAARQLAARIQAADLQGSEQAGGQVAQQRLTAAAAAFDQVAEQLTKRIQPAALQALRDARERIEQALDALASEPRGRARSQLAFDPKHQKIVMFGGDALERVVADTWLYDCRTRTWEQKFPATCPLPRAGHVLAWLPKAKRIVLAGGYSRDWLAQEIWTYDVAANEWRLLQHVPLQPEEYGRVKFSQDCPRVTARGTQLGAVTEDDTLVCLTSAGQSLTTWACRVDPARPAELPPEVAVGASGQYTWNRIAPADWEHVADPDAERMKQFFAQLPPNQWTSIPFAKYAPGATNRWGTSAYDTQRHQVLLWGGGHATSHENDVSHFSLRGGCWTLGYHPDDPIEIVYASQPTPVSFADRPHVPVHAYRAYCYDPAADMMHFLDRSYDLTAREWRTQPLPGLSHRGVMHTHMAATPHGAVTFSGAGLFRFDAAKSQWRKLPWDGPQPESIWCDGDGLCYDSKRDALWLSIGADLYRYDFATGRGEKPVLSRPPDVGKFIFQAEAAYIAHADLILVMRPTRRSDGRLANLAFAPADNTFRWLELPFVGADGKPVEFRGDTFSWHDAIAYDPELKLAVLNSSHLRQVFVLRLTGGS